MFSQQLRSNFTKAVVNNSKLSLLKLPPVSTSFRPISTQSSKLPNSAFPNFHLRKKSPFATNQFRGASTFLATAGLVQDTQFYAHPQPQPTSTVISDAANITSQRLQNVSSELHKLGEDLYNNVDDLTSNRSQLEQSFINFSRWLKRTLKEMFPTNYQGVMNRLADAGYYTIMGLLSLIGLSVIFALTSIDGSHEHANSLNQSLWGYWFPTGLSWATLYVAILIGNYAFNSITDEVKGDRV